MEKLEKKVRTFAIVGILLLIAFIAGIPMTVLGATKGITALLVIGIVFIVAGFYVSPIMLVQVTEKRKLKRVIMAVEKQNLYSVDDIAAGTGLNQKAVRGYLNESMQKGYIAGFKMEGDELILIRTRKQALNQSTQKCPNCGAQVIINPIMGQGVCPYCGAIVKETGESGEPPRAD